MKLKKNQLKKNKNKIAIKKIRTKSDIKIKWNKIPNDKIKKNKTKYITINLIKKKIKLLILAGQYNSGEGRKKHAKAQFPRLHRHTSTMFVFTFHKYFF